MDCYLTRVMPGHGTFNAYLFCVKIVESPKRTNCDRRGWDDAWHTMFECAIFQQFWEETITYLRGDEWEASYTDSLVPIMFRNTKGWNQVATIDTSIICHKMELARGAPIAVNYHCHQAPNAQCSQMTFSKVHTNTVGEIRTDWKNS